MAKTRLSTASRQPFFVQESVPDIVNDINNAEAGDWIVVTEDDGRHLAIKASEVTWLGQANEGD
jgi:tellurite resistance-related uncharacterized protein